eukprot:CAMPEP_0171888682 /NCGR_PEP_ID=MMETSP0992-20121227/43152_1 /TAXON_ID=483369 /ORGANISM="non described non described, Strain CCMP2098" /LENGTH=102 /DNA_ID=CAMNT_0012515599 /DNA_START=273 /DNA_END=582 /DNA_ORIENTATION=-
MIIFSFIIGFLYLQQGAKRRAATALLSKLLAYTSSWAMTWDAKASTAFSVTASLRTSLEDRWMSCFVCRVGSMVRPAQLDSSSRDSKTSSIDAATALKVGRA